MESMLLETERMLLRPITVEDVPFIYKLFSRAETNQFTQFPDITSVVEVSSMNVHYMNPADTTLYRAIMKLKALRAPIGALGLFSYSKTHKRAELGYDLLREYWGKGLMTEAVREVLEHSFTELDLIRIDATVDPDNISSIKLLERTGFKFEACLRKRFYYRDKWHDEHFYGLLKEEWENTS